MNPAPFSLCIYCGARPGLQALHAEAAASVGRAIAARGWQLVYGGGHTGLMGTVADAALAAGGRVVGVIPHRLVQRELGHPGLQELHKVGSMHERKQMMADRSDAFLALPGGVGTLEELFEAWTWLQLGYHAKPVALLNVGGYYDALLQFMQRTVAEGFLSADQFATLLVDDDAARLLDRIAAAARKAAGPSDYSQI